MKEAKTYYLLGLIIMIGLVFESCKTDPTPVGFVTVEDSGEEGSDADAIITLGESVFDDVTIEYSIGGTVAPNDYYMASSINEVTIPAGESNANISFTITEDSNYDGPESEILEISITGFVGSEDVVFGDDLDYTYTIMENDTEIKLTWVPSEGVADDVDLDLYVYHENDLDNTHTSSSASDEDLVLDQSTPTGKYYVVVHYFSGLFSATGDKSVEYTMTISRPDGTSESHSNTMTYASSDDRTLYAIDFANSGITLTQDPFGSGGRIAGLTYGGMAIDK